MAYLRIRSRGESRYFYIVESRRRAGKVRQRIVQYLGDQKTEAAGYRESAQDADGPPAWGGPCDGAGWPCCVGAFEGLRSMFQGNSAVQEQLHWAKLRFHRPGR